MLYLRAWRAAVAVGGVALIVPALAVAPVDTVVLGLLGAALGTTCSATAYATTQWVTSWVTVRSWAIVGAGVLPAVLALARWSWPTACVVLATSVVSAPPVVRRLAARRTPRGDRLLRPDRATRGGRAVGDPVAALLDSGPRPRRLATADTDTVCAAWRGSHLMLAAARSCEETLLVARVRELYLDELSRRHPAQMAAWFAAEPLAVDGPERYLPGDDRT
ncbi:hypothetical protein [Nocardioides aurantiacus]|uniref:hypothetical protein n=1 Tax=Nocardioides aurantiacus TaxID=86796 RepID=UPI00403F9AF7